MKYNGLGDGANGWAKAYDICSSFQKMTVKKKKVIVLKSRELIHHYIMKMNDFNDIEMIGDTVMTVIVEQILR